MTELLRRYWKLIAVGVGLGVMAVGCIIAYVWIEYDEVGASDLLFFFIAAVVVCCAGYAVLTRNIVRAVFALLGTFFGMAGIYAMLSADFVAVVQIMVYVGGILVLMLFAVMLTSRIDVAAKSSRSAGLMGMAGAGLVGLTILGLLASIAVLAPWPAGDPGAFEPTVDKIGNQLIGEALLPFELLSILLLGVVIGAVVIARMPRGTQRLPSKGLPSKGLPSKDGEASR